MSDNFEKGNPMDDHDLGELREQAWQDFSRKIACASLELMRFFQQQVEAAQFEEQQLFSAKGAFTLIEDAVLHAIAEHHNAVKKASAPDEQS